MVQIRTMEIPDELTLSAGISSRIVSSSTLEEGLTYRGGGTDFLGFGSSSRALPKEFQELAGKQLIRTGDRFNPGLTPAQIESLGEQLDPVWGGAPSKLPPDIGLGLHAGGKFDLFGARAGALVSVDYSSSWLLQRQQFTNRPLVGDGTLAVARAIEIRETQNEIGVSGLGSFAIDFSEEHQLRLTSGVFRISLDRAQLSTGIDDDVGGGIETHVLEWSERMVNTNQLRGTHVLVPDLELRLEWRYQFSLATSDQPNRRALTYIDQAGQLLVTNDGNERFYSSLLDRGHETGFDLFLPLAIFGEVKSTFSGGFSADIRNRDVDVRRYFFRRSSADPRSAELRPLRPNELFNSDTIAPGLFELEETTRGDDNYLGKQSVFAGYGMVELGLSENISVLFGARLEAAVQKIETQGAIADPAINMAAAELQRTDLLPAVTATWTFIRDMQLRAAFAQTVNRPNFRELSPGAFIDQTRALEYRGNPDLERAVIYHGDLRWEWYPSPGESLSVAAFGKYIRDPIENALDSGANLVARPINTERATNFGVELEGRKNFGFLGEFAEDLYIAGNLTLVSSNVSLGDAAGALTSKERALQGQSPYAINAQLGYENFDWGFSGTLLFNVFGPRISSVGLQGVPDIFEQPQPTLDLVLKQTYERYALSLKLQNIFDPAVRFAQREPSTGELLDRERYQRGRRLSLSLTVDLD
jgi:outer membrane receptor protein involved in Fe transport